MALKKISNIPNLNKATKRLKQELPLIISNEAKNHFLEGFRKGGYQTDESLAGWPERKQYNPGTKAYKRNTGRAILVKTGHLRNDIDVRKTQFEEIVIGTNDTDYGVYHNEGEGHLPKREFLGDSKKLNTKMGKIVERKLKQVYE